MGVTHKFSFLSFAMGHFDCPITKKITESWEAPENSTFYVRMEGLPLGSAIL
jgi:hypothetical protein